MTINDRLTGITTFVRVVEAGNFALAAERLHLTRSAVGKSIARLEQRLGVLLFHRNPRGLNLTLEGQAYYDRCLRALSELDAADAELNSGRREPQGCLRVSAPKLLGRHCITPILMRLLDSYPELRIDIRLNDRVADLVEEGFDLAIRIGPLADSVSLIARRLGDQYLALCAAPAYLAARGTPEDIAALDGHSGVAYHRSGEDVGFTARYLVTVLKSGEIHRPTRRVTRFAMLLLVFPATVFTILGVMAFSVCQVGGSALLFLRYCLIIGLRQSFCAPYLMF